MSDMWLIKFRFGCVVIEQRTTRNMNDPDIVADVIAKATIDVIQNYFNIYDQLHFDGVTFEWLDNTYYDVNGALRKSVISDYVVKETRDKR